MLAARILSPHFTGLCCKTRLRFPALLKKIPDTNKGWPGPNRVRWFRMFAMNVSQIYDADDGEPVEMKIDLETKEAAN
jgi:hypothetical protein